MFLSIETLHSSVILDDRASFRAASVSPIFHFVTQKLSAGFSLHVDEFCRPVEPAPYPVNPGGFRVHSHVGVAGKGEGVAECFKQQRCSFLACQLEKGWLGGD